MEMGPPSTGREAGKIESKVRMRTQPREGRLTGNPNLIVVFL